ncbi:MAG: hypothetical protein LBF64_04825 [Oscillospiraceae bacterium]|jgi:hypothetical protein|nr:hypothetical protein [Oscillospiraceae bacterium]
MKVFCGIWAKHFQRKDKCVKVLLSHQNVVVINTLLPRSGNEKQKFALWAAEAAHVGRKEPGRWPEKKEARRRRDGCQNPMNRD